MITQNYFCFEKKKEKWKKEPQYIWRWVWRYQWGNQNPYIEKGQTTQWPREKGQKDKQRNTKHTHKTKDRVTKPPLKPGMTSGTLEASAENKPKLLISGWYKFDNKNNPHYVHGV
jgi:hypothetical protein